MFSGQGHEAHQGAMYRLLARGLRGMRGGDLSRNEQLAHNVGIACMLIVNHTRVRAAAIWGCCIDAAYVQSPSCSLQEEVLLELLVEVLQKVNRGAAASGSPVPQPVLQDGKTLTSLRRAFHSYVVFLLAHARDHGQEFVMEVLKVCLRVAVTA